MKNVTISTVKQYLTFDYLIFLVSSSLCLFLF
nr:MAG TPA: hypothetical protein [Caudoviricetes sp.]